MSFQENVLPGTLSLGNLQVWCKALYYFNSISSTVQLLLVSLALPFFVLISLSRWRGKNRLASHISKIKVTEAEKSKLGEKCIDFSPIEHQSTLSATLLSHYFPHYTSHLVLSFKKLFWEGHRSKRKSYIEQYKVQVLNEDVENTGISYMCRRPKNYPHY